jgi:hypothetical protein
MGYERFKSKATECFEDFQNQIKERFGFTPVGFNFHMDEGHVDKENNLKSRNYHAHVVLFNFDFETKLQPLRTMKPQDFSEMQDIAGKAFEKLGYQRGLSKEQTKAQHLEKEQHIERKLKEADERAEKATFKAEKLEEKAEKLEKKVKNLEHLNENLMSQVFQKFQNFGKKFVEYVKNQTEHTATQAVDELFKIQPKKARQVAKEQAFSVELEIDNDQFKKATEAREALEKEKEEQANKTKFSKKLSDFLKLK